MDKSIKQRWINRLESGMYEQHGAELASNDLRDQIDKKDIKRMCCIGVLCDIFIDMHPDQAYWDTQGEFVYHDKESDRRLYSNRSLPKSVALWAKINPTNDLLMFTRKNKEREDSLAGENDISCGVDKPYETVIPLIKEYF